jgi:hypothetical protein
MTDTSQYWATLDSTSKLLSVQVTQQRPWTRGLETPQAITSPAKEAANDKRGRTIDRFGNAR